MHHYSCTECCKCEQQMNLGWQQKSIHDCKCDIWWWWSQRLHGCSWYPVSRNQGNWKVQPWPWASKARGWDNAINQREMQCLPMMCPLHWKNWRLGQSILAIESHQTGKTSEVIELLHQEREVNIKEIWIGRPRYQLFLLVALRFVCVNQQW